VANEAGGKCEECDQALPAQTGKGRRRRYCDATCRSAARRRRTPPPPALCEARVGWWQCPAPAVGQARITAGTAQSCAEHRGVVLGFMVRVAGGRTLTWRPYAMAGRPETAGPERPIDEHEHQAAAVAPAAASGYALLFSAVDGWELYDADDGLVAGHDGYDGYDVVNAQEWAAELLAAEHDVSVADWVVRPNRFDLTGDGVEYVALTD
jgi:hypothetical protein